MDIGTLNRRIVIEAPPSGQDALGQPTLTWTTVDTVWASIINLSGIETIKSGAPTSVVKTSVRVRWRTDLTSAMRATCEGVTYRFMAVMPDMVRREYTDITCEVVT